MGSPESKFDGRHRRKFKRACCCVGFLLLINTLLLSHTAHSIGRMMWFVMNGSFSYHDTTYLFVPGGAQTLCNDLCVDVCIYDQVGCDLNSCLNLCNEQLIDDGNIDNFQFLAESDHRIVDDLVQEVPLEEGHAPEIPQESAPKTADIPQVPEERLNRMRAGIESVAENVRTMKTAYTQKCGDNPDAAECNMSKMTINQYIVALKKLINDYDAYAVSVNIDIRVEVWMVDVDEVTADP